MTNIIMTLENYNKLRLALKNEKIESKGLRSDLKYIEKQLDEARAALEIWKDVKKEAENIIEKYKDLQKDFYEMQKGYDNIIEKYQKLVYLLQAEKAVTMSKN